MFLPSPLSLPQVPSIVAGLTSQVFVNRGWRQATVLATDDQEALIEYQMPHFSGLRILRLETVIIEECSDSYVGVVARDRHVRYKDLSTRWLAAIVDANQTWIATPLRRSGASQEPLPPPDVLLERKTAGEHPSLSASVQY